MSDIELAFNQELQVFDWVVDDEGNLLLDNDLITCVKVLLFTWRRDVSFNEYGWWGDSFQAEQTGSRLKRAVQLGRQTLVQCQDYCQEALKPLITLGAVASFDVVCSFIDSRQVMATITAIEPDGSTSTFNYSLVWSGL